LARQAYIRRDIMLETNVIKWAKQRLNIVNITLALLAIGIEVFYSICGGSCSYLSGYLFGIDLQYIGIAFMALIIFLNIIKKDLLLILALSAGIGIEAYLIGFQVWYNTYCPYCLAFGGVLMIMFFLNIRKTQIKQAILCMVASLIVFAFFFKGSVTPVYGADTLLPSFGTGTINVRIYTDYFCSPCRAMEPKIEPLLSELLKKNDINVTFVDVPFSRASVMYAKYFLYIINEKKDFDLALLARSVLIGASLEKITDQAKLEEYLKNKGLKFKPFDTKPTFDILNGHLKEDKIQSTPTCVIDRGGKTEQYNGGPEVISALERLKEETLRNHNKIIR
jgi:thiol-disulfide isomerase/thioredoxin